MSQLWKALEELCTHIRYKGYCPATEGGLSFISFHVKQLARVLDAGELPELAALRIIFGPDPAQLPTVHVQLASLNSYKVLMGTVQVGEVA